MINMPYDIEYDYLALVGSRAYGMESENSDYDFKGFIISKIENYFGLKQFEQYEHPDNDIVVYDIKKFFKLALQANPSILELLWADEYNSTPIGDTVRTNRDMFLSNRVKVTYAGYAVQQIRKCRMKLQDPDAKAGIKAKDPYKHAAHCLRLLYQCKELLDTGILSLKTEQSDRLKEIKNGNADIYSVLFEAEDLLLEMSYAGSVLPNDADHQSAERVLVNLLRERFCK